MDALIVCGLVAILFWSLLGRRLEAFGVTGPLAVVILGAASGALFGQDLGEHLDTKIAEKVVEIVLAVLLFVDATEVRRGLLGGEGRLVTRLIAVALPISLCAAVGAGALLIPGASWAMILLIACIVIPTDFAASAGMLRDARIPGTVRHALNVESGYNDGIVSPIFVFALALAEAPDTAAGPVAAIEAAVTSSVVAIVVGLIVGGVAGFAVRRATNAKWLTEQSLRVGIVVIPLLVYVVALPLNGNGFVAAFVAGIAFRATRLGQHSGAGQLDHREMTAVDDVGVVTSLGVWFVFGAGTVLTFEVGFDWQLILFGLLALTALRMLPVYLALLGSSSSWRERTAIGLAGPRGTASIVFGLLAFNALREDEANTALYVTMVVVLGSVIFHGAVVPRLAVSLVGAGSGGRPRPSAD